LRPPGAPPSVHTDFLLFLPAYLLLVPTHSIRLTGSVSCVRPGRPAVLCASFAMFSGGRCFHG
jgi:hypothetical protein